MSLKKNRRILRQIFHITGADKIIITYFIFFIAVSVIIWQIEPYIKTFMDSLWFCFATATTIGYGDITALTIVGRILSIILSIYSLAVVAVFTAVITSYFMESSKARARDNARRFIDDLQHLDELSKGELKELSERIKKFNKSNK